ncbi:hypothetical protein [Encephalitozoon cuniculi GB-M1]|uniref:Non-structural maintenance of chromosomes element 4 n=1 Tax=Encephalitozoon cuniculi (strain GB-M1) TaxID=284813 RepID=Q8SUJ5_ENCCU|nr:uncharacterized protein ECU08_1820 [Encephalitozoon cuniculi GB-M1]CAD26485.2 hypothetical protein [Encephalitozoon cuniculi GB-M1]
MDEDEVHDRYLNLLQEMRLLKEDLLEDKCRLDKLVSTSNMLFKRIKTSSELKLDAKITALSTKLACTRMEKDINLEDITPGTLVELARKDLLHDFYRYAMDCSVGMRFPYCFSLGVHGEAPSRRRAQSQRSRQTLPETEVPTLITREKDSVEEPEILAQIKRLVAEKGRTEYFRFVIDPRSFSKTIENIFYLSLSLRSGVAFLEFDDDGTLYVVSEGSEGASTGHLVVEMTYDEYLRIVERMGISKAMIGD